MFIKFLIKQALKDEISERMSGKENVKKALSESLYKNGIKK